MSLGPVGSSVRCIKNQLGIRPYRSFIPAVGHHHLKPQLPYRYNHNYKIFSTIAMSPSSKPQKVVIQLHYNDLRTHDSPVLSHVHSAQSSEKGVTHFLPIYVFDERVVALSCVPGYEEFALRSTSTSAEGQEGQDEKREKQEKDEARPTTIRGLGDLPRLPPSSSSSSSSPSTSYHTLSPSKIPHPKTRLGAFHKTSRHRLKFLTESVFNLRESYRGMGGDLVVGCGFMEGFVGGVVEALQKEELKGDGEEEGERFEVTEVWMQKEVSTRSWGCFICFGRIAVGLTFFPFSFPPPVSPLLLHANATQQTPQVSTEEVHFQRRLRAMLEPYGTVLKLVDSKPMVAPEDLPFGIEDTPDLYTSYRKVSIVPISYTPVPA
jgi:hypothetical protein